MAAVRFPSGGLNKPGLPSLLLGSTTAIPFYALEIKGANLSASTSRFSELVLPGDRCSSQVTGNSLTPCKYGFCSVAPCRVSKHRSSPGLVPTLESLLESPAKECSMGSGLFFMFSILVPQVQRKYQVQQAEPPCLVSLLISGRLPGIPEWAVLSRLTHFHSSYRHGAHTIGLVGGLCSPLGCCRPACRLPPQHTPAHSQSVGVAGCCHQLVHTRSPGHGPVTLTDARTQGGSWQSQTGCLSWKAHQLSLCLRGTAESRSRTEPHF